MTPEYTNSTRPEARGEPRTSLFVMATLYAGSQSSPVMVRDLSPGGALIEGGVIPASGTSIRLCRGALKIAGEVMWCRGRRAGLRFGSGLQVNDWLPGRRSLQSSQYVDEIFHQVRASPIGDMHSARQIATLQSSIPSAEELDGLIVAIESLADDLIADPELVKRHAVKLQTLDLAAQALRKLAAAR